MYPYDPLRCSGGRQLLAGPTITDRSGASDQTKHSPATSFDHGAARKMVYDHCGKRVGTAAWANHPLSCY